MECRAVNILLVEDNPGDARLITEMLRETAFSGANLVTTTTLRETLDKPVEPSTVAMVLLDLNLPDSNGIHTLERVLPPYSASAIIVLTGLEDEGLALDALRHGAQNYLTKGHIGAEQLERELRYAVERHGFVMRLREADNELVGRERRFRSLVEHSSDLTLQLDNNGRIIYASPGVHRMFGHTPMGSDILAMLDPLDEAQARAWFDEALEHPERPVSVLLKSTTHDGRRYTLEGTITNLRHFEGVGALVVNLHDVTKRDLAMEEVVSERNSKKALINSSTDMIWSVDREFRIITANRSFVNRVKDLAGFDVSPGRTIVPPIRFGSYDSETWKRYYSRALEGASFVIEEHSDGEDPLWGEFTFNPILEGDRITGVACACRDITERKRTEQHILQLNARLEERVEDRTRQLMNTNQEL
ncbi:MAG TPA: PAS domain S-box protein, partial [Flavobacteriales bacterium]